MKQGRKIYVTLTVLIAALLFLCSSAIAIEPCNNYICKAVYYFDGVKEPGTETFPVAIVNDTSYSIIFYFDTTCSVLVGETFHMITAPPAIWTTPAPYIGYDSVGEAVGSLVYIGSIKLFDAEFVGPYNTPDWGEGAAFSCVITSPTL